MWCGQLEEDRAPQVLISEVQDGPQEGFPGQGASVNFFPPCLACIPKFLSLQLSWSKQCLGGSKLLHDLNVMLTFPQEK